MTPLPLPCLDTPDRFRAEWRGWSIWFNREVKEILFPYVADNFSGFRIDKHAYVFFYALAEAVIIGKLDTENIADYIQEYRVNDLIRTQEMGVKNDRVAVGEITAEFAAVSLVVAYGRIGHRVQHCLGFRHFATLSWLYPALTDEYADIRLHVSSISFNALLPLPRRRIFSSSAATFAE